MDRFDVHKTRREQQALAPYLVLLSTPQLLSLGTVVVAPLLPLSVVGKPVNLLQPVVELDGKPYVLVVNDLLSLPRKLLGPRSGSLNYHRVAIVSALDFLFQGY